MDEPMLEVGRVYRLRVWCRATVTPAWWRLETEDGQPWPSNTNDALTEFAGAPAAMVVHVQPFTARVPPASLVVVQVRIRAGYRQSPFDMVRIVMPEGFVLFERGQPVGDIG